MFEETPVFKCGDTGDEFFRERFIVRETPLSVGGDARRSAGFRLYLRAHRMGTWNSLPGVKARTLPTMRGK